MAAFGQPKLLTYRDADGTIRLFDFNPSIGFVQVATTAGGLAHNGETDNNPYLGWRSTGDAVILSKPAAGTFNIAKYDLNLQNPLTGHYPASNPNFGQSGNTRPLYSDIFWDITSRTDFLLTTSEFDNVTGNISLKTGNTISFRLDNDSPQAFPNRVTNGSIIRFHPHEFMLFVGSKTAGASRMYVRTAKVLATGRGTYAVTSHVFPELNATGEGVKSATWANLGQYLILATDSGKIFVYEIFATSAVFKYQLNIPCDSVRFVRCAPNGKFVAISTLTGTTYSTNVYYREGGHLFLLQTLASGVGKCLDFSADSRFIVDCNAGVMMRYDVASNSYLDNSQLMAAVPLGITAQAMSPHLPQPVMDGFPYTKAVKAIVEHDATTLPLTNLKLMLSNEKPEYRAYDTLLATDADANEVWGAGWRQGGTVVLDVAYTAPGDGNKYGMLVCDPVEQIVVHDLAWRYAILYNADNRMPIVFYDMGYTQTAVSPTKIIFDFSDHGLLGLEPR